MEVGRKGVALSLVALLAAILLVLYDALPRIVNLGSVSQVDGTDTIFLILVLVTADVDLNLVLRRSHSFRSFY